jgi:small subunit ribosomal protein S17
MIIKKGTVVKVSGKKTVKVEVNEYRAHPKYKKQYRVTKNFLVHNDGHDVKEGDNVVITPCRKLSKMKSWMLIDPKKQQ